MLNEAVLGIELVLVKASKFRVPGHCCYLMITLSSLISSSRSRAVNKLAAFTVAPITMTPFSAVSGDTQSEINGFMNFDYLSTFSGGDFKVAL